MVGLAEWLIARVDARISLARDEQVQRQLRARVAQHRKNATSERVALQRKRGGHSAQYRYSLDGRRIATHRVNQFSGEEDTMDEGDDATEDARAQSRRGAERDADDEGQSETILCCERHESKDKNQGLANGITDHLGIEMEVERWSRRQPQSADACSSPIHSSLRTPWMPRTRQQDQRQGREMPWESVAARMSREDKERTERAREDERERLLRSKMERMVQKREQSRQLHLKAFSGLQ